MKKDEKDKKEKKLLMGLIIIFVIALIALAITVIYINQNKDKNEKELPYTDLIKEMNYGNIEKNRNVCGKYNCKSKNEKCGGGKNNNCTKYSSFYRIGTTKSSRRK